MHPRERHQTCNNCTQFRPAMAPKQWKRYFLESQSPSLSSWSTHEFPTINTHIWVEWGRHHADGIRCMCTVHFETCQTCLKDVPLAWFQSAERCLDGFSPWGSVLQAALGHHWMWAHLIWLVQVFEGDLTAKTLFLSVFESPYAILYTRYSNYRIKCYARDYMGSF